MDGKRNPGQIIQPGIAILLLSALSLLALVIVRHPLFLRVAPPCPFYVLTSYSCPGCGTLRSLHQLALGNLTAAFRYNPLTILTIPFLAFSFVRYLQNMLGRRKRPPLFIPSEYIWIFFAVVVSFGLLRNIL